jgi:hypothetical protein
MRTFFIAIVLTGCGSDNKPAVDAPPDVAPVTLDCSTYCTEIHANCTDTNAQYPSTDTDTDTAHCMATCALFPKGALTDTSVNSLGCRIHYAGNPSKTDPAMNCAQAGPGGDPITTSAPASCSGGNVCTSFCTLEIQACGSLDAPLSGNPTDATNNPLFQYRNMADCMTTCAGLDKTHAYSTAAMGDSLACRLLQTTSAAIGGAPSYTNAKMYCAYTGEIARGPCVGTSSP